MYGDTKLVIGTEQKQLKNQTTPTTATRTPTTQPSTEIEKPTTTKVKQFFSHSSGGCRTQTNPIAEIKQTFSSSNNTNNSNNNITTSNYHFSTCSVLTPIKVADPAQLESCNPATTTHMTLFSHRRRRLLQRHACLLSILAAFVVGLVLGVLAPMLGMSHFFAATTIDNGPHASALLSQLPILNAEELISPIDQQRLNDHENTFNQTHSTLEVATRPPSDFPTIYGLPSTASSIIAEAASPYAVAFVKEQNVDLPAVDVFRNAFHLEQVKDTPNTLLVKKLDTQDGSIKEFRVERLGLGRFRKGPERRISKPSLGELVIPVDRTDQQSIAADVNIVPIAERIVANAHNQQQPYSIIKSDIYWGDIVEQALPQGFSHQDAKSWSHYVTSEGIVVRFEPGCGRMQNRLIIFADGTRACARYRQNTDQIQGEIFSFYLGQLLNISNLAPSTATVVDLDSDTWSGAITDITQAQWKQQRPVVLTRWLPDLEPAGIPQPFQPLERHLNKYDVWNITLSGGGGTITTSQGLLQRLGNTTKTQQILSSQPATPTPTVLRRLVELAQWSDLIIFDYLIANLDRVVNNLYNYQWNADIMAAPAHNLARQTDSQLLVFLDNESGLLHGYRLLKKYEAYHGVLLDNLCVFRQPTIDALRQLRLDGAGRKLREIFEQTTSNAVRDVLPSLPDKSIKILVDRIDRVLGQVQKCKDLLADR